jgi:hypothetical protein
MGLPQRTRWAQTTPGSVLGNVFGFLSAIVLPRLSLRGLSVPCPERNGFVRVKHFQIEDTF